jgi:hypothetical protein
MRFHEVVLNYTHGHSFPLPGDKYIFLQAFVLGESGYEKVCVNFAVSTVQVKNFYSPVFKNLQI